MGCSQKTPMSEERHNHHSKRVSNTKNTDIRKNYEFISMLGNGSFGKVRLYRDRKQKDLLFAIKTMKKENLDDKTNNNKIYNENDINSDEEKNEENEYEENISNNLDKNIYKLPKSGELLFNPKKSKRGSYKPLFTPSEKQEFYKRAFIPNETSLEFDNFGEFYEKRKKLLRNKIIELLK